MQTLETVSFRVGARAGTLFDEDGYLLDHALWSQELGRTIAAEEGIGPLTADHWRVIEFIRAKFFAVGALPNVRLVCRGTSLSKAEVYNLFGGCLVIWRIAGLPNPGEEAKTYLT